MCRDTDVRGCGRAACIGWGECCDLQLADVLFVFNFWLIKGQLFATRASLPSFCKHLGGN